MIIMSRSQILFQKIAQQSQKYRQKIMNNWKILNKIHPSSSIHNKSSNSKYTPKKQSNASPSTNRFVNNSMSRNQSSIMIGMNSQRQHSTHSNNKVEVKERILKNCASQLKLKKQVITPFQVKCKQKEKKSIFYDDDQIIDRIVGEEDDILGKYREYERDIRKLKVDFQRFQTIIITQLQRQEKIMETIIKEIVKNINRNVIQEQVDYIRIDHVLENLKKDHQNLRVAVNSKMNILQNTDSNKVNGVTFYSPSNHTEKFGLEQCKSESRFSKHRQKPSFDKFFRAVNNLKNDMTQISQQISVRSPKAKLRNISKQVKT